MKDLFGKGKLLRKCNQCTPAANNSETDYVNGFWVQTPNPAENAVDHNYNTKPVVSQITKYQRR